MRDYTRNTGCASIVIALLVLAAVIFVLFIGAVRTSEYTNLTVVDKSYAGDEDSFIIWMEDESGNQYEFTNQDELFRGKFNSSTIQGKIKVGNVYNVKTCGWRVPFLSWYENIIEYELVEDNNKDVKEIVN